MKRIGVNIGEKEFNNIKSQLKKLKVPKDVCINNRYWDPFTLDRLYRKSYKHIPSSPFESDYVDILCDIITGIKNYASYYYNKYFPEYNDSRVKSLVIYSQEWSKEISLRELLDSSIARDRSNITKLDEIISNLTNRISYSIPKLLKPILDMQNPQNPLLGFIEMGAYYPLTRRIISIGVPRETAIMIRKKASMFSSKILTSPTEDIDEILLKKVLRRVYPVLGYWEQKQIEDML